MTQRLGPAGRLQNAAEGASEIGRFLSQVPALLTRAGQIADQMDEATRNGLVLAPETVAALTVADRRARRGQTAALWVIAALLAGLLILALR